MEINKDEDVRSMIKPESEASGMLVKIKMPRQRGTDEKLGLENEDVMKKNTVKRVCEICQKEFSSGKALGGHMSSHVQLARDKKSMKPEDKSQSSGSSFYSSAEEKKGYVCAVCRRRFPSMKALSGHMRCHPERSWKGINPPPTSSDATSADDKDREIDLKESLWGWSTTAKRGRKSTRPEDDPAVIFLMMLARGEEQGFGSEKRGIRGSRR